MDGLMNHLAEDLDSELLAVPFDAWLLVCEKTMQRITKRLTGFKYQPITEAKARLWYLRYRHQCAETYTDFLKSVLNCNAERSPELDEMIRSKHPNNNKTSETQQASAPPPAPPPPPVLLKHPHIPIVDYDIDDDAMSMVSSVCGGAANAVKVSMGQESKTQEEKDLEDTNLISFRFKQPSKPSSPVTIGVAADSIDAPYSPTTAHRRCADWEAESDVGSPPAPKQLKRSSEKLAEDWEKEILDDTVTMEYPEGSLNKCRKGSPYPHIDHDDIDQMLDDSLAEKKLEETNRYRKPRLIQLPHRDDLEWKKYVLEQLLIDSQYVISPNFRFEDPRVKRVESINVSDHLGSDQSSSGSPDDGISRKQYKFPGVRIRRKPREMPKWEGDGDIFSEIESKSDSTPDRSSISISGDIREEHVDKMIAHTPTSISSGDSDISDDVAASMRLFVSRPPPPMPLLPPPFNFGLPFPMQQNNSPVVNVAEADAVVKPLPSGLPNGAPSIPFHLMMGPPPLGGGPIPFANNSLNIPTEFTFPPPFPIQSAKSRPVPPPPPIIRKGGIQPTSAIRKQNEYWKDWQRR